MLRSMVRDDRPQIPAPGPGWTSQIGVSVAGGEIVLLDATQSGATSPLIPVYPSVNAQLSYEVFLTEGDATAAYVETRYFAADRVTPAANRTGNVSNGHATPTPVGEWAQVTRPLFTGPEIHWLTVRARISSVYGNVGTRYRDFRLTLAR